MLIIRKEQMEAFSQYMIEQFEESAQAYLRKAYAEQLKEKDDAWLRLIIKAGIKKARGHGFELESQVRRYIECMLLWGEDFDANPDAAWAAEILNDNSASKDEKLKRIMSHLEQRLEKRS